MPLLSDLISSVSGVEYVRRLRARYDANGVPWRTWLSVVNIGESLTQYVSEALSQDREVIKQYAAGLWLEFWEDASELARTLFAKSQYGLDREQPQLQRARFLLRADAGAASQTLAAGAIAGTAGPTGLLWYADEAAQIEPGQRALVTFVASAAGPAYNVPIGTTLELKSTLAGVSLSNPPSGEATNLGSGTSGLVLHAAQDGVSVEVIDPGAAGQPLLVTGNLGTKRLTVSLATDGGGVTTTTAEQARDALMRAVGATAVPQILLFARNLTSGAGLLQPTTSPLPLAWAGTYISTAGASLESKDRLRRRCETRWDTLGGGGGDGNPPAAVGTEDALVHWGLQTPAGYTASPVRWVRALSNNYLGAMSANYTTIILAGPAGPLPAADVAAVAANYERPKKYWGRLVVVSAITGSIPVAGTVYVRSASGLTLEEIAAKVATSLAEYQQILGEDWSRNQAPIIYPQKVGARVEDADKVAIARVDLTFPPAPVVLAWNEFPVFDTTTLGYAFI